MQTLVIGGSGFVGFAVVRALMEGGHTVSVLNRGSKPLKGVTQLTADRNDAAAVATTLERQSFDYLVDTNAYTGAQARIVTEALKGRISLAAVISSAAVYADGADTPAKESNPVGGGSAWGDYGKDKTQVEQVYSAAGFPASVSFRPPYIYGPNNDLDRERWFFRRILHRRPVLVPGAGQAVYQFLHEDDLGTAVVTWLAAASEHNFMGFSAYNLADPELITSANLAALLGRVAKKNDVDVRCVSASAGENKPRDWFPFRDVDCAVDPTRFMSDFDWRPAVDLEHGFSETLKALQDKGPLDEDDWTPLEDELLRRLGEIVSARNA